MSAAPPHRAAGPCGVAHTAVPRPRDPGGQAVTGRPDRAGEEADDRAHTPVPDRNQSDQSDRSDQPRRPDRPDEPGRRAAGAGPSRSRQQARSREQELLAGAASAVLRLHGQFLAVADDLARPAGLTAAWWQVLAVVLREPLPVAGIARAVGLTRQSVQRVADLLVDRGLATYRPNPAHRRAKLLAPTRRGRAAVERIEPGHREFAARLSEALGGEREFDAALAALTRLAAALERLAPGADTRRRDSADAQL